MEIAYSRDGISNQDILSATLNGVDAHITPHHTTSHHITFESSLKPRMYMFLSSHSAVNEEHVHTTLPPSRLRKNKKKPP